MTEVKLTNQLLLESVQEIERAEDAVADMKIRFSQIYGGAASNLLNEVMEQRKIARDAQEYAEALLGTPDIAEEDA